MNQRRARLEAVLAQIRRARLQLELQPEVFEATVLLKNSEAELAALIAEMFSAPQPDVPS